MADQLVILPRPIQPPATATGPGAAGKDKAPSLSFERVLDARLRAETGEVKFSRHAADRMASRGINLNPEELLRLNQAVDLAGAKGARDSLVLLGETALVVSIRNQTVVTVVDKNNLKGNMFTNIDSAIII